MKTAQTTARTAREMFYFVDDVQRMLGYSRSKSYKIIKQLNDELEAQGKMAFEGRVNKKYFDAAKWRTRRMSSKGNTVSILSRSTPIPAARAFSMMNQF